MPRLLYFGCKGGATHYLMFGRGKRRRPSRQPRYGEGFDIPNPYIPDTPVQPRPAMPERRGGQDIDQYMYRSIMSMIDEPEASQQSREGSSEQPDGFEKSGADSLSLKIELPAARASQLRALARELDESPQSLARLWVMERLRDLGSQAHKVRQQGSNGDGAHNQIHPLPELPAASVPANPTQQLAAVKARFREAYVSDPNEQVIYDETYAPRQWLPYIAAIVLTAKGRRFFTLNDILQVLRDELIPDLYDTPTVPESGITLKDVELGRPGEPFRPYACLERDSAGVYSYLGFSKARAMRAGR